MTSVQNYSFTKWLVNKMTGWWNDRLMKWQVDEMAGCQNAGWLNYRLSKEQVDQMTGWWNDRLMNWQVAEMTCLIIDEMRQNDRLVKIKIDEITG